LDQTLHFVKDLSLLRASFEHSVKLEGFSLPRDKTISLKLVASNHLEVCGLVLGGLLLRQKRSHTAQNADITLYLLQLVEKLAAVFLFEAEKF